MASWPQEINKPSQLTALKVWRLLPARTPRKVVINANLAPADQVHTWERQLNRLQSSCGCDQGAAGLIVGLVAFTAFLFLRPGGWGHPGSQEFWVGLGVVTVTSTAGKFVGLWAAQRRLDAVIKEIQANWRPENVTDSNRPNATGAKPLVRSTRCCGDRAKGPKEAMEKSAL